MKPLLVLSKLSPRASRSDDLMVTLGSRRMFAGALPSAKKRQPAASSSLLILIRAVASLSAIRFPIPPVSGIKSLFLILYPVSQTCFPSLGVKSTLSITRLPLSTVPESFPPAKACPDSRRPPHSWRDVAPHKLNAQPFSVGLHTHFSNQSSATFETAFNSPKSFASRRSFRAAFKSSRDAIAGISTSGADHCV